MTTPQPARRIHRIEARVTASQKRLVQRAAARQGRSVTEFIVASARVALEPAPAVINLSPEATRTLFAALENPPARNPAFRAAQRRYRQMIASGELTGDV